MSISVTSVMSVGTQHLVNQLIFSSLSTSLVKSWRSLIVDALYAWVSTSRVWTAAPPVPKYTF